MAAETYGIKVIYKIFIKFFFEFKMFWSNSVLTIMGTTKL